MEMEALYVEWNSAVPKENDLKDSTGLAFVLFVAYETAWYKQLSVDDESKSCSPGISSSPFWNSFDKYDLNLNVYKYSVVESKPDEERPKNLMSFLPLYLDKLVVENSLNSMHIVVNTRILKDWTR